MTTVWENVSLIASALLTGGLIANLIANNTNRRIVFIQTITRNRIDWMSDIRKNVSDLCTQLSHVRLSVQFQSIAMQEQEVHYKNAKATADGLFANLQMQLNPYGRTESRIVNLAHRMVACCELTGNANEDNYRKIEKEFLLEVQCLLKSEWERAKLESRMVDGKRLDSSVAVRMGTFLAFMFLASIVLFYQTPVKDGARQWTAPLWPGGWMAWTFPTALFFFTIFALIALMGVWEAARPGGAPRRGVLGIETTRGDRLFISLLGSAFLHLGWLGLVGPNLWWALALSLLFALAVFRFA